MRTMRCDRRCDSSTSYKQLAQASRSKGFVLDLPPYNSFPSTGSRVIQALSSCSCCGSCSSSFVSFQVFESLLYSRSPFSDRPSVDLTPPWFAIYIFSTPRFRLSSLPLLFTLAILGCAVCALCGNDCGLQTHQHGRSCTAPALWATGGSQHRAVDSGTEMNTQMVYSWVGGLCADSIFSS